MSHSIQAPRYRAFLLRCWCEGASATSWRFSLEQAGGGQRRGFTDLGDVIRSIQASLAETANDAAVQTQEPAPFSEQPENEL
jgi:hypothetical protein